MNELQLIAGHFMGHTLRRTQVFLPDRVFIPIPVTHDAETKPRVGAAYGGATSKAPATAAQCRAWAKEILDAPVVVGPQITLPRRAPPAPPIMGRWDRRVKAHIGTSLGKAFHEMWTKLNASIRQPQAGVRMGSAEVLPDRYEVLPHLQRSAYLHANPERAVPLIRVEAQPTFFLDDTVGMALLNSVASVCDTKHGEQLARDVHSLRAAVYRPMGLYKPDLDRTWGGKDSDRASMFFRQTLHLDDDWDLDIRHCPGVYQALGRSWLGVFVTGMVNTPADGFGQPRRMAPTANTEGEFFLNHRNPAEPLSLAFDLFVPCEPEIVTEEWGWGEDLETLTKEREVNAAKEARLRDTQSPPFPEAEAWDAKAGRHKSVGQIDLAQLEINREAAWLGERYMVALKERERARQVLYSYAWKALLLAIMECRQLTVEKR